MATKFNAAVITAFGTLGFFFSFLFPALKYSMQIRWVSAAVVILGTLIYLWSWFRR